MASTCAHGLPAADCLICKTLGTQPKVDVETPAGGPIRPPRIDPAAHPDAIYLPRQGPAPRPRSVGTHVVLLLAALVAIGVVVWIVAGAVIAMLHLIELLAVAVVAGWAGYRLGFYRGHRRRP